MLRNDLAVMVPITSLLVTLPACHRAQPPSIDPPNPTVASLHEVDSDAVWVSIQETLRRRGFRLDRVDREAGVVTTMPETSQHYFELWRRDVATRADFWEATFNPIRRWVEVQLTPAGEVSVIVHKERLSSLDRQFNNTGSAYQYFANSLPATTGQERVLPEHDRWVKRGRDVAMEKFYLSEIMDRASMNPG